MKLHVYRLNTEVDSRNALMLDGLAPKNAQYRVKASDSIADQTSHISLSALSDKGLKQVAFTACCGLLS